MDMKILLVGWRDLVTERVSAKGEHIQLLF